MDPRAAPLTIYSAKYIESFQSQGKSLAGWRAATDKNNSFTAMNFAAQKTLPRRESRGGTGGLAVRSFSPRGHLPCSATCIPVVIQKLYPGAPKSEKLCRRLYQTTNRHLRGPGFIYLLSGRVRFRSTGGPVAGLLQVHAVQGWQPAVSVVGKAVRWPTLQKPLATVGLAFAVLEGEGRETEQARSSTGASTGLMLPLKRAARRAARGRQMRRGRSVKIN